MIAMAFISLIIPLHLMNFPRIRVVRPILSFDGHKYATNLPLLWRNPSTTVAHKALYKHTRSCRLHVHLLANKVYVVYPQTMVKQGTWKRLSRNHVSKFHARKNCRLPIHVAYIHRGRNATRQRESLF